MNENTVRRELQKTIEVLRATEQSTIPEIAAELASAMYVSIKSGGKLLIAGNGGSAADAQHMAAEFVNYFSFPRNPLAAIALTTDTSILTSISNDSNFEFVFSRQVAALGKQGDVLWLYTTSGNSKNIIEAAKIGKSLGLIVASFVGENKGKIEPFSDFLISVPSSSTPKVQEVHLTLGHAISGIVEAKFFGNQAK